MITSVFGGKFDFVFQWHHRWFALKGESVGRWGVGRLSEHKTKDELKKVCVIQLNFILTFFFCFKEI